ncbi:asparagine synthase-related protein [Novosphingobium cyanobacteriorum]|uniref:asparagine synthase (glutamine-hydrolyzing) n=1 Tax=Novosphingobium cyanobacteriorum TaxID=3024215 RepID=A0ABT6CID2_9SPHN|nr:asparagine synthase-related protein [Novosphingobium cyanobacteriorum]MDF8333684.1 asparagine synthase-related protein [Novosphingobium cyanobacteriorum]
MNAERYRLCLGQGLDPAGDATAIGSGMVRRTISAAIRLLAPPHLPVLCRPRCLILGQFFGKTELADDAQVCPADLVRECWGNYIAVGISGTGDAEWILRAPLGHLPVLMQQHGEHLVLASDAPLIAKDWQPAIDPVFVTNHLAFAHLKTAQTGLEGVEELLWGECLHRAVSGGWRKSLRWSPWDWTTRDLEITEPETAASMLRTAIIEAVARLAPQNAPGLLELSGGLDSSVLAAALAEAHVRAHAATLVTAHAEGDERSYARQSAKATGVALDELDVPLNCALAARAPVRTARSGLPAILWGADAALARRARETAAPAFLSGAGGDCVFSSPSSAAPAADLLLRSGWSSGAWQACQSLARIHDENVWAVARSAHRLARNARAVRPWHRVTTLLVKDAVPDVPPAHPWLEEPDWVLPGKRDQVRSILASLAHVDGYPRHRIAPTRFPLLSQPVVEVALRIASWLWIAQGSDRAVARAAWRGALPRRVLERRTKGGLDAFAFESLAACRADLRPFLLDGHVAALEIIDRNIVEKALSSVARRGDAKPHALLPLIDTEAWLRSWYYPDRPTDLLATPRLNKVSQSGEGQGVAG